MPSSNNSGALTIDFAGQAQNLGIDWSLDEITGAKTSGTNGADAVVQSAGGDSNAAQVTTFTVTLSAFASATNAAYGAIASSNNATALTHEGGYTELSDHGVSFARLETEYKASSDTSVSWTVDTKVIMGALAVEIAEATATGRSFGVII
jgi:acetoin utilization deacetylase AcuC-like enzyme